jgi:hypothetical protein
LRQTGGRNSHGRPPFKPTDEQRNLVKELAAVGAPHKLIARKLGIRSPKTLRKHFRDELDLGSMEVNAHVAKYLYQSAKAGNVEAQKSWLRSRAGWGTHTRHATTDRPPFIVAHEEPNEPWCHENPDEILPRITSSSVRQILYARRDL